MLLIYSWESNLFVTHNQYPAKNHTWDKTTDLLLLKKILSKIPSIICIKNSCSKFTGKIKQIPPIFSALKKNGKRLYELARENKKINLNHREVTIYESNRAI